MQPDPHRARERAMALTNTSRVALLFASLAALTFACTDDDPTTAPQTTDAGVDAQAPLDAAAEAQTIDAGSDADAADALDSGEASYAAVILADAPAVYYRLGEATGTTAKNAASTGAAYDLTFTGVAPDQLGQPSLLADKGDTAVRFAGDVYASLPLGAATPAVKFSTSFTIEAWLRPEPSASLRTILSTKGAGADGYSFILGTNNTLSLACHGKQGYSATLTVPADGAAHYVAVVWEGGGSTATFYVDGQSESTSGAASLALAYTSAELRLGDFADGQAYFFVGTMDEVAAYPVALSSARLAAHYAAGH